MEKSSLEDLLMDAILQKNCLTVNKILEQGVNANKLCRGRTPLGVAAEIGDTIILNSILATITNQNSNTSNNASLTTTTTTSTEHRTKKQKCDYSSVEENSAKNVNKSVDKKNLGYFIMVHGDIDVNNPLCEQPGEEKTPEGMDALEWDVEIKDNQDDNQIPERERDQWVSLYRWYADILDKAADMLKVPIIYDINQQDSAGKTALHYAAHRGRIQAAQILINAGCQLDIASSDSCTPLHMACQSNSLETLNLLLESGARVDSRLYNKKTPLHLAAKRDRADFVEALIKKGAQIDAQDAQDRTPLSIAVMNEAASAVEMLLKYGAKVNFEDVHGYTPLCEAVWQKSETMVRTLLNAGAKITQSHCLLHSSVWHQDKKIAQMLLDAGSVPNMANNEGDTPIFVAVRNGDIEMVELLLRYGAEINYFSVNGKNVIHEVVDHLYNVDEFKRMFEFLVENGADVNQHSCLVSDLTPLSRALFFERPGVAAVLIRHGIDINFYDSLLHEYTLCVARRKKYFTISRLLIYSGFDPRNHSTSDLKYLPDNSMYDVNTVDGWLAYVKHNPLSLSQLCRIHIRRRCGTGVYKIVNQLPLPNLVKKYLKLEDEECENSIASL